MRQSHTKNLTGSPQLCKANSLVADVAQLAEHQVVALGAVGSIPIIRPRIFAPLKH